MFKKFLSVSIFSVVVGGKLIRLLISVFVEITLVATKPEKLAPSRQDIFQGMMI